MASEVDREYEGHRVPIAICGRLVAVVVLVVDAAGAADLVVVRPRGAVKLRPPSLSFEDGDRPNCRWRTGRLGGVIPELLSCFKSDAGRK